MTVLLETQLSLFFGRVHPLIVHLPIGFIVLAVVFELIAWKNKVDLHLAVAYGLLLGAISGVIASTLGLLLATGGGYNESTLAIHQWTGISTTLIALAAYYLKRKQNEIQWARKVYTFVMAFTLLLLSVAGHYGGTLTHGSTYLLEHAPNSIRLLAGMEPIRERITSLDSALVYEDVIHHIFKTKCNVCHNSDKAKGDLLLTSAEDIKKGGENGSVLVAGNTAESELFRRITLDSNHDDFMPTEGRTPLTKEEVALIEWWIEEGIPFNKKVIDLTLSDRTIDYLKEIGIGAEVSFLASIDLPAVEEAVINSIEEEGFKIRIIANTSTLLEASYSSKNSEKINEEKIQSLMAAKEQITWLTFKGSALEDAHLSYLGGFPNLTKLNISQTMISDAGIRHLEHLEHLEYLNVYGTQLTDEAVESLSKLSGLKKLYVWQTGITEEGVAKIEVALVEVEVVK
jgi:uncharacterized membrane protein